MVKQTSGNVEIHSWEESESLNYISHISLPRADALIWNALTWDLPSQEADVDKKQDDLAANFQDAPRKTDNAGRGKKKMLRPSDLLLSCSMNTPAGRGHGEAAALLRGIWVTRKERR